MFAQQLAMHRGGLRASCLSCTWTSSFLFWADFYPSGVLMRRPLSSTGADADLKCKESRPSGTMRPTGVRSQYIGSFLCCEGNLELHSLNLHRVPSGTESQLLLVIICSVVLMPWDASFPSSFPISLVLPLLFLGIMSQKQSNKVKTPPAPPPKKDYPQKALVSGCTFGGNQFKTTLKDYQSPYYVPSTVDKQLSKKSGKNHLCPHIKFLSRNTPSHPL